jgi:hypothetical protein
MTSNQTPNYMNQNLTEETRRRLALGLVIAPVTRNRRKPWHRRLAMSLLRFLYTI